VGGPRLTTSPLAWAQRWQEVPATIRVACYAAVVYLLVHALFFRWCVVQDMGMYATLLEGDLVAVDRTGKWFGAGRGSVVVFRDPLQNDRMPWRRRLMVGRLAALPGDTVQLRNGKLWVNGARVNETPTTTHAWMVQRGKKDPRPEDLGPLGLLPRSSKEKTYVRLPLNERLAAELREAGSIVRAEAIGPAHGTPSHIFPHSPYFRWNADQYGPLRMPAQGDTITLTAARLPLYDRMISIYEGNKLRVDGQDIYLDHLHADEYVVQENYGFVLCDSRDHGTDSRYWGFLPMDHVVGKARLVMLSWDRERGQLRPHRWFRKIQ
jgi:signal peptidase I